MTNGTAHKTINTVNTHYYNNGNACITVPKLFATQNSNISNVNNITHGGSLGSVSLIPVGLNMNVNMNTIN